MRSKNADDNQTMEDADRWRKEEALVTHQRRLPRLRMILLCNLYLSRCGMETFELHNLTNLQPTSDVSEYSPLVKL